MEDKYNIACFEKQHSNSTFLPGFEHRALTSVINTQLTYLQNSVPYLMFFNYLLLFVLSLLHYLHLCSRILIYKFLKKRVVGNEAKNGDQIEEKKLRIIFLTKYAFINKVLISAKKK